MWRSPLQKAFGCSLNVACGQGPTQQAIPDSKVLQFTNGLKRSHGGAFEQVGCHHKRTKCYWNNYSKGGKGDGLLNEFASKLWIFGHIFGISKFFWSKETNLGSCSNKVIEWKTNEKGKKQVVGNYV